MSGLSVVIKPGSGILLARSVQLVSAEGAVVASKDNFIAADVERFERLAAAWNTCEGMPDQGLQAGLLGDVYDALKVQREWDEHLEGCSECQDGHLCDHGTDLRADVSERQFAALSKAEGRE